MPYIKNKSSMVYKFIFPIVFGMATIENTLYIKCRQQKRKI